jgi:hypothetical protein
LNVGIFNEGTNNQERESKFAVDLSSSSSWYMNSENAQGAKQSCYDSVDDICTVKKDFAKEKKVKDFKALQYSKYGPFWLHHVAS